MGINFGFGPSAHAPDAVIRLPTPVKVLKSSHLLVDGRYLYITVIPDVFWQQFRQISLF